MRFEGVNNVFWFLTFVGLLVGFCLGLWCCMPLPPEPVVIERKCAFPELRRKPVLPPVLFVQPDEECTAFRCVDEQNAELLKQREILLREDSNYVRGVYEGVKEICE